MGDIEKLTDILMDTLPEHHPWEGEIRKFRDDLIANGVTVRERGRWVPKTYDYGTGELTLYHCPKCDTPNVLERNFCPNCGADMRGEEDGT